MVSKEDGTVESSKFALNGHATGAKMAECVNSVQRALKRMCLDEEIDKR